MHLEDSIIINATRERAFQLARDVEHYHEFVPGYKPGRLRKESNNRLIIEREAEVGGKLEKWESAVNIYPPNKIEFTQTKGKLKGMKVRWTLEELGAKTRVSITHDFSFKIPLLGWILETFAVAPRVNKTTAGVLRGLKSKLEE